MQLDLKCFTETEEAANIYWIFKRTVSFVLKTTGKSFLLSAAGIIKKWLCELPISAAANGYGSNEPLKVCLWFMDSFFNAVSNNQIFLCCNCGAWHPRHYKAAQDKPTEFELCVKWTPHILGPFPLLYLIYLSPCPRYLLLFPYLKA